MMASKGETFGMVTIEAMMCGLPVIGTESSGTPEILGHGKHGLLFEPNSVKDASKKIRTLLEDPDLAKKLGVKAQKKALKKYALDKVIDGLIEAMEGLHLK